MQVQFNTRTILPSVYRKDDKVYFSTTVFSPVRYNLSAGAFAWSTGAAAASTASIYARIVLEYVDNSKSIDLYH